MASGKTHLKVWRFGWPISVFFSFLMIFLLEPLEFGEVLIPIFLPLGYALGRWIDPDLDLIGPSDGEGRLMKELPLLGAFIVGWFIPYAYLMKFIGIGGKKGHRNFFSHAPIIGTLIRFLWLFGIPLYLFYRSYPQTTITFILPIAEGLFIGLALADFIHFLLDLKRKDS